MPTSTCLSPFDPAIWLALGQLVVACGGQAVNDGNKADTTGAGDDASEAAGSETAGTGSDPGDDAGGTPTAGTGSNLGTGGAETGGFTTSVGSVATDTGTTGSSAELREAAFERAARFVNDYGVACKESKEVTFPGADQTSAYPTRVLQTRGRPEPWALCGEIADADDRLLCMMNLACDFEWSNQLDWSQWSADATVIEIVGLRPEQINVAYSVFDTLPDPSDPDGPIIRLSSFYEQTFAEAVPPGSHDCAYWWYLDPTPEGVALVLSSPMAGDLEGELQFYELSMCLTE